MSLRERAVAIKSSLDRIEVTLRREPRWTSGLPFTLPLAGALGWMAGDALGGGGGGAAGLLDAAATLHPALAVPLAVAGVAALLGAASAIASWWGAPEDEVQVRLDTSRRAQLEAGRARDGARGPAVQHHLGVVQRIDLRWERLERRSWATFGLIPYDVRGALLIAALADGSRVPLVPFAVADCDDAADAVRECNYALRSWQVVRERESRQRGEEPPYAAPPDPRATSISPREAHQQVVAGRFALAGVWVLFCALLAAVAWPAASLPPLRRDLALADWARAWWGWVGGGGPVPLVSALIPAEPPRSLALRGEDGGTIAVTVRSGDGSALAPGAPPAPDGPAATPAIEIRMGHEVIGRVYPEPLPYEEAPLLVLASGGAAGASAREGAPGGEAVLAAALELFEAYRERMAASRPALVALAGLYRHDDERVATVAIASVGLVGDEACLPALRAFRAELLQRHRGEEGRARLAPLLARIDETERLIRARTWELR